MVKELGYENIAYIARIGDKLGAKIRNGCKDTKAYLVLNDQEKIVFDEVFDADSTYIQSVISEYIELNRKCVEQNRKPSINVNTFSRFLDIVEEIMGVRDFRRYSISGQEPSISNWTDISSLYQWLNDEIVPLSDENLVNKYFDFIKEKEIIARYGNISCGPSVPSLAISLVELGFKTMKRAGYEEMVRIYSAVEELIDQIDSQEEAIEDLVEKNPEGVYWDKAVSEYRLGKELLAASVEIIENQGYDGFLEIIRLVKETYQLNIEVGTNLANHSRAFSKLDFKDLKWAVDSTIQSINQGQTQALDGFRFMAIKLSQIGISEAMEEFKTYLNR